MIQTDETTNKKETTNKRTKKGRNRTEEDNGIKRKEKGRRR